MKEQKNKLNEKVITISRSELFRGREFSGVRNKGPYLQRIKRMAKLTTRAEAEESSELKQPIPYAVLINEEDKIYYYIRSRKGYSESRLAEKGSIGVGGHIEEKDLRGKDFIREALLRELREEVKARVKSIRHIGYINREDTPVSRVHFGLLHLARISGSATSKNREIKSGEMLTLKELEAKQMEEWSAEALKAIKKAIKIKRKRQNHTEKRGCRSGQTGQA